MFPVATVIGKRFPILVHIKSKALKAMMTGHTTLGTFRSWYDWLESVLPAPAPDHLQMIMDQLKSIGFTPCNVPELAGAKGVWAPSSVLYEERHFLLKSETRKVLVRAIRGLAKTGRQELNFWIGRHDPYAFQRAQFLDHHLPLQVRNTIISIKSLDGRDGLFLEI